MAGNPGNYLSCPVCLEDFTVGGDTVPRILPCIHTLCEKCVHRLIKTSTIHSHERGPPKLVQRYRIVCPECRQEHKLPDGAKSLKQNPYILDQLSGKEANVKKDAQKRLNLCVKHSKELNLFCEEADCKKPICITCLREEHKTHCVVEVEDKKQDLLKKVESVKKDLADKTDILLQAKENMEQKTDGTVKLLKERQLKVIKTYDDMIASAQSQGQKTTRRIDDDVTTINEKIQLLDDVKNNMEAQVVSNMESLSNGHENVTAIIGTVRNNFLGKRTFTYSTVKDDDSLEEGNITVILPEIIIPEKEPPRSPVRSTTETSSGGVKTAADTKTTETSSGGVKTAADTKTTETSSGGVKTVSETLTSVTSSVGTATVAGDISGHLEGLSLYDQTREDASGERADGTVLESLTGGKSFRYPDSRSCWWQRNNSLSNWNCGIIL